MLKSQSFVTDWIWGKNWENSSRSYLVPWLCFHGIGNTASVVGLGLKILFWILHTQMKKKKYSEEEFQVEIQLEMYQLKHSDWSDKFRDIWKQNWRNMLHQLKNVYSYLVKVLIERKKRMSLSVKSCFIVILLINLNNIILKTEPKIFLK